MFGRFVARIEFYVKKNLIFYQLEKRLEAKIWSQNVKHVSIRARLRTEICLGDGSQEDTVRQRVLILC